VETLGNHRYKQGEAGNYATALKSVTVPGGVPAIGTTHALRSTIFTPGPDIGGRFGAVNASGLSLVSRA
jgi:hypothetical protein